MEGVLSFFGIARTDGGSDGLLLAMREHGRLHHVGTVEWGVQRAVVDELVSRASRLDRPTPSCEDAPRRRDVQWLEPRLMAEVSYASITQRRLRDPVYRGLVV